MDDIVKAAMLKWPNVPHCFGWLGLDSRGQWYMRDAQAQALGPFASGIRGAKGSLLKHDKLIEFIQRNYLDETQGARKGQWFFQNGPQRVYVELELTPWIWRVQPDFSLTTHTGINTTMRTCWLDELGHLYADTELGCGLVHSLDVLLASEAVEQGIWHPQFLHSADMPHQFGFVPSPEFMQIAPKRTCEGTKKASQ